MEVLNGYKETSIGVLPSDWEVKKLGNLIQIKSGESPSNFQLSSEKLKYPYLKVEDLNNCDKYQKESRYYSNDEFSIVQENSVIFPKRGAAIINNKVRINSVPVQMDSNLMALTVKVKDLDFEFLYYKISKEGLFKIADTSTIPQINNKHIEPYKIPLPPLPEQQKIAEILSAWDKAIEICQKIIDELKQRNKGLAQQLLSGKINNKNEEDQLKDYHIIGKYVKEVSKRNTALLEKRILSVTNSRGFINQSEQFGRELASADLSNYKIVKKGQFAYNPSRVNVGSLDMLRTFDAGVLSPMYVVFEVTSKDLIPEFLYYHLKTYWFIGHIPMFVQGSVRDTLSFDGFSGMKFYIPTLEEQKKIVTILDAAASELKQYEEKLTNLKLQKKGLMQQLLTGKVRTV